MAHPVGACHSALPHPPPEVLEQVKEKALALVQAGQVSKELILLKNSLSRFFGVMPWFWITWKHRRNKS
jgi:hypothetical protein